MKNRGNLGAIHAAYAGMTAAALITTTSVLHADEINKTTVTVGEVTVTREIHDTDGDGWCDLWCSMHPKFTPAGRNVDTDGDGVTDYDEMVFMRNPLVAEPMPKKTTAADLAKARQAAQIALVKSKKAWKLRKEAAFADGMELVVKPGSGRKTKMMAKRVERMESLKAKSKKSRRNAQKNQQKAEQIAAKHGFKINNMQPDGSNLRVAGEANGYPLFVSGNNRMAAASISADELWDASVTPWASGSTGLNLTGSGQTFATWEANGAGGVLTSHQDFGGRVNQRDGASLDTTGHATLVTGTMIGTGIGNASARGVAYEANVEAFDLAALPTERLEAADGTYGQVLVVGNNSWSLTNGWRLQEVQAGINRWVWFGGGAQGDTVDAKFGRYTESIPIFSDGCVDLDNFVHDDAPHHLPVYSCGNDRGEGPGDINLRVNGVATPTFFVPLGGGLQSRNKFAFPRDYVDGDEGGSDSLATPGTAKNVLTVGACLDVASGNQPGFAPGVTVTPADFSGAGPTDDGRLKPDLVAVGDVSASVRNAVGVPVTASLVSADFNGGYSDQFARGTSFSAPAVTGGMGLMLQRREQLYPGLAPEDRWLSSTLKAIAINGCDDSGSPGPDYRLGHGLFNVATSVAQIEEDHDGGRGSQIKEFTLDDGESVTWIVEVASGSPLSITAAWVDPAGPGQPTGGTPDIATPALVNNLDIKIENIETGQTLLPWVLNPDLSGESVAARQAPAFRGVDSVNNVERISEAFPVPGFYEITVTHSGAVSGTATAQEVSVVSTNAMPVMAEIDSIEVSPVQNEFIINYTSDPGAHYIIESSTTLEGVWANEGTTIANGVSNTIMVDTQTNDTRRFWRLKRQ